VLRRVGKRLGSVAEPLRHVAKRLRSVAEEFGRVAEGLRGIAKRLRSVAVVVGRVGKNLNRRKTGESINNWQKIEKNK